MNGKKAKMLRRITERVNVGKPERIYMKNNRTDCIILGQCSHMFYNEIKKDYKDPAREGHPHVMTAIIAEQMSDEIKRSGVQQMNTSDQENEDG